MSERIGAASSAALIALTLLPVFYARSGFSGQAPIDGQRRFIQTVDSYARSVPEELRMLKYSQRLGLRARNVIADAGGSTGGKLFGDAIAGGNAALGSRSGLSVGNAADLVALDATAVPHLSEESVLDHWIFAGGILVDAVWVGGRRQVEAGRHTQRAAISARFRTAMAELLAH